MTAPKGNKFALRPGATASSKKRHVIPVTEEEHAAHHELARARGKKLADLVRELLNAAVAAELGDHETPARRSPRRRKPA